MGKMRRLVKGAIKRLPLVRGLVRKLRELRAVSDELRARLDDMGAVYGGRFEALEAESSGHRRQTAEIQLAVQEERALRQGQTGTVEDLKKQIGSLSAELSRQQKDFETMMSEQREKLETRLKEQERAFSDWRSRETESRIKIQEELLKVRQDSYETARSLRDAVERAERAGAENAERIKALSSLETKVERYRSEVSKILKSTNVKFNYEPYCYLDCMVVPIILSSDDNYAPYMYVTMYSALENAMPDTFYDFYLLVPSAFSKHNTDLIMELKEKYNCDIHFIDMKNAFADLTMHIPHITSPTYYRLLAGDLLPKKYDKCIYLDVDVCVCRDLASLYNIDMGSNYIAGVVAAAYYLNQESHCKRLDLPSMEQYVNAGVLLMNLKQIRQDNMTTKFIELSKKNYSSQDQDVINIACYGRILTLPVKYNVMTKYKALFDADHEQRAALEEIYGAECIGEGVRNPVIVHYADKIKPWNDISMKMMGYWWKYAQSMENTDD